VSEPFTAYRFRVEIVLPGAQAPLCDAAFAECDGLELRFDVRALREGGDNVRQRLVAGPASYGEVTLRRGMTPSFDLWDWCALVARDPGIRADARVILLAPDGEEEHVRFVLHRCLPVRLRAPRLDAVGGVVAIEELQLACEALTIDRPGRKPPAGPKVKAELLAPSDSGVEPKRRVVVPFNPESLRLSHGEDGRATLRFRLDLDAGAEDDVRRLTEPVAALAALPRVVFRWGTFNFDGRIVGLEEELDLFSSDGRPLRAALALTLRDDQPTRRAVT
jgi:phage tail-like protein